MRNNVSTEKGEAVFYLFCHLTVALSVFVLGFYMFKITEAVL